MGAPADFIALDRVGMTYPARSGPVETLRDISFGVRRGELLGLTWEVDLSRSVLRLEITKSGKRREVPLNDSYRALVSLEPKAAGRVFRTRSIRTAFDNAVEAAKSAAAQDVPSGASLLPGRRRFTPVPLV